MDSPRTLLQHPQPLEEGAGAHPPRRRIPRPGLSDLLEPPTEQSEPPSGEGRALPSPLVLGRYRLIQQLGAGGFGVVWRARDELLHREVAVKCIHLGPDGDSERATREALASARLRHPAIVALFEACPHEGTFYLISELVEGATLARLIAEESLTDERVLEIGLALVGALSHAHARGVIHRDIKPQNVLVPLRVAHAGESAKLTDFGGASLAGEDALTRTGNVLGTLAYMAPEQCEGADVGEEADLYSLALVLYEALSGVNPVRGPTPAATVRRIGRGLEPLARSRRDLPRELCEALDRPLAGSPHRRGSLEDLGGALEDALEFGLDRPRRGRRPRAARAAVPALDPADSEEDLEEADDSRAEDSHAEDSSEEGRRRVGLLAGHPPGIAGERLTRRPTLPRRLWLAGGLAFVCWEAWSGLGGLSLLVLAALLPAVFVRGEDGSARLPLGRLSCALAPVLGIIAVAGAFPAVAGQARVATERAARGAIGYWWLLLAGPLLGRVLWLSPSSPPPPKGAWEGSVTVAAAHVIAPELTLGALLGAVLWAAAAVVLPWIVRGRHAALDLIAVSAWAGALVIAARALDSGLAAGSAREPHGAVLGAILGAAVAIAIRAVRGPT